MQSNVGKDWNINNDSSKERRFTQTCIHSILPRPLSCARVCPCPVHACAHYTPLAKPNIPMEGLTKRQWAQSVPYEHCSPPSFAGPGWGHPQVSLYPPKLLVVLRGGGTHGSPIPLYVSLSVCGFTAGPPYTHQGDSCGGMPPRHCTWLRGSHLGGTSPLPYLTPYPKTHGCSRSSLSLHPTVNPVGGGGHSRSSIC